MQRTITRLFNSHTEAMALSANTDTVTSPAAISTVPIRIRVATTMGRAMPCRIRCSRWTVTGMLSSAPARMRRCWVLPGAIRSNWA